MVWVRAVGDGQCTRYSPAVATRPVVVASGLPPSDAQEQPEPEPLRSGPTRQITPKHVRRLGVGAAIAGLVIWAWRHVDRVEVAGLSMAPTLQPGDRLVVWRTTSVRPGDIVAASDPRQPERTVLKRVISVYPEGVFLLGDNPGQSTDSRQFGNVPIKSLLGKALYRYAPPGRAGRLF